MAQRKLNKTVKRIITNLFITASILILAAACVEDGVDTECDCQEQTTGVYKNSVNDDIHYVSYKDAPYANCEDDGKIVNLEELSTTRIICKEKQ